MTKLMKKFFLILIIFQVINLSAQDWFYGVRVDRYNNFRGLVHHFTDNSIYVDTSCNLSLEEKQAISKRKPYVDQAIRNFIGEPNFPKDIKLPKIAIAGSGGGYRAMICFLGFMMGAGVLELQDLSTYIATLSGSTWFLGNYLLRNFPINEFKNILQSRVVDVSFFNSKTFNSKAILEKLWNKYKITGTLQTVDFWGALLADRLWGDLGATRAQQETFQKIRDLFYYSNKYPFPIFAENIVTGYPYLEAETTPFTMGSDFLGGYIPTYAFGSKFEHGECTTLYSEDSLGTFLGIFGSAYDVSLTDILEDIISDDCNKDLEILLKWLVEVFKLNNGRVLPAKIYNFTYEMDSFPLSYHKEVEYSDGGMDFVNIPFPQLLRPQRNVDIILVCDASSDADYQNYPQIWQAKQWADVHGYKFPSIDNPEIKESCVIFEDKYDPTVPTVVYFPNIINFSTIKFDYSQQEFDKLWGTMSNMVIKARQNIIDVIKRKIENQSLSINYGQPIEQGSCFDRFIDDMSYAIDSIIYGY